MGGALRSRAAFLALSGADEADSTGATGATEAIGGAATFDDGGMIVSTGTMPPEPAFCAPAEELGNFSISAPAGDRQCASQSSNHLLGAAILRWQRSGRRSVPNQLR